MLGEPIEISRREGRWLALGADLVAFAADDEPGWRRLTIEGWLLGRWKRAGLPVARVLAEHAAARVQVRERLHGRTGLDIHSESSRSPLYPGDVPDVVARLDDAPLSDFGARLAASYGDLVARIRRAVTVEEASAAGFGLTSHRSLDVDEAIARLQVTNASIVAKRAASRARDWLAALSEPDAVIHGDLHFFNLCVDDAGMITGLFDLSDAGIDAAAEDLSHVHSLGSRFASIALEAYGPVDVADVRRAHLRSALDHLLWHGPETPRHASIVAWATAAFEKLT